MARDEEDDLPRRMVPALKNLDPMGIAELEDYIAGLEAEIARARAAIEQRRAHRQGIDSLFKK
jgi:uncharacterized small protein (DUF1192 family)